MVTETGAYGAHRGPIQYRPAEPPGVTEVRSDFESVLADVLRELVNRSVHATSIGLAALDAGDFITLDELEARMTKG